MTSAPTEMALTNARVATCDPRVAGDYGLMPGLHAITARSGIITSVMPMGSFVAPAGCMVTDLGVKLITPGLIDCHTHLVFGGDRAAEWEMRLKGKSYAEIAQAGGGILSTVRATRACNEEQLFEAALGRLRLLARDGVICVEVKSGYGLSLDEELKILRVIKRLARAGVTDISATLLAAHTIPPEYKSEPDTYVTLICEKMIPQVAQEGLAEAVDVFCEPIAFSLAQCERIFKAAERHGLAIKAHAEQLSHTGCAKRAAEVGAWSVDHIEHLAAADIPAIKAAGTVGVLLPGAFYALREKQRPPIEALRQAGVPLAVATDCNPGTSPFTSIRMMLNLAAVLFSLTPAEAIAAVTAGAARALGRIAQTGTITVGKEATVCVWEVQEPAALVTDLSSDPLHRVFIRGEERHA